MISNSTTNIPKVSTMLTAEDMLGAFMVRFAINRNNYRVEPGLYAVGDPTDDSNVFVSANYKLSFDVLRSCLKGINGWILVLDTHGINVWCAAGKGTFGTDEIVNRIKTTKLDQTVKHRKLIVPQLGAPGVAAHEVKKQTGFSVIYGPVRAQDIPAFLGSGMKPTKQMRAVTFSFIDRLHLVPLEMIIGIKYLAALAAVMLVLSFPHVASLGIRSVANITAGYLAGTIGGPLLLPWLPGRSFALKGFFVGLVMFLILFFAGLTGGKVESAAWLCLMGGLASFMTLEFTGASTYASPSGVEIEMKFALPTQLVAIGLGSILWIVARFI